MKNYQLIPTLTMPSGLFEPHEVTVPGANRNSTMAGLSGTLIKMELPSGGIQEYDYEQNVARNMVAITTPTPPISYLPGGGAIHAELNEDGSIKLQYSFEFSTPDDNSTVQITFRNGPKSEDGRPGPMGYIQNDKLQNIFSFSRPFSQVKYKFDKKGKYRFYIDFAGSFTSYAKDFHFGAGILAPPGTVNPGVLENAPVGGYRLKRSKLTDPKSGNEIIKRYTYLSSEDNTRSSGFLPSRLSFWEYFLTSVGACQVIKLSSYSNATLSTTAGAPVGYDHVTEYLGENGEFGKNEYFFTNAADKIWRNPYTLTSREHHRGKLSGEYNYKFENGKHFLIKSISNSYADSGLYVSAGLKIADHQVDPQLFGIQAPTRFMRNYRYNYYDIETDFYGLSSQTISTYNDKDTSWVIHDYKYYPGNLLISSEVQRDKSRSTLTTFLRYPYDMVKRGELIPYEEMLAKNVISPVIEEEKKKNETSLYVLKNEYDSPFKTFFKAKHIFLKNGAGLFEKRVEYNYNRKGNVINIIKEGVLESNYLWSYNGQYPIAEINNAKYSVIESLLGGNLNVESFSEKSNPTDIEVRNFLNPLRNPLNLLGSTSSTFTYKPLIGMSSSEDVKGLKTYYDYDNYNRLWNVRDHNRNIIKNYEYNYQHKEVRTYSNTFQSAVFKKRCQVGQVGSDAVFSVQEGTFHSIIDVNDANRQAIAHIQANGQAYANINGTCNVNTATLTYSYTYGSPWTITGLLVDKATNQSHFLFGGAQSISSLVIPQGEYRLDLTWAPTAEQGKYYVIGLNGNNQTINTSYGSGKQSYDLNIVGPYAITLKYQ